MVEVGGRRREEERRGGWEDGEGMGRVPISVDTLRMIDCGP